MGLRPILVIAPAVLLVVPLLIVQAQTTEGETPTAEISVATVTDSAPANDLATALPTVDDALIGEQTMASETTASEQPTAGAVLGAATETADTQSVSDVTSEETDDSEEVIQTEVASSTASSTELAFSQPAVTETRTVFLQTSVEIDSHLQPGPVAARITLQNLTCRDCDTTSPSATIKVYYTQWYDNDGAVPATTTERLLEQTYSIPPIDPWQSRSTDWTGEITIPGRYSFIVLVDPENQIGARDTYRTEFFVD